MRTLLPLLLIVGMIGCGSGTESATPSVGFEVKLTACPDCGGKVSKRASQCPHCGAPLKPTGPVDEADKAKPSPVKVAAAAKAAAEKVAAGQAATKKPARETPLTLKGHSGGVTSVSFSPDGKRIVSGSGDNTLKVWDISSLDASK